MKSLRILQTLVHVPYMYGKQTDFCNQGPVAYIRIQSNLYNGHLRTEFSGRCKEVAVMGRFSMRGSEGMDQKLGQENMGVEERWSLVEIRLYIVCVIT